MRAVRSNPALWERSKKMACTRAGLCKHSARKMQWAVRHYKKKGGKYEGARSEKNGLRQWTKQEWRTLSGRKSEGKLRYLPSAAWDALTEDERRRTNRAKRRGSERGKQWVPQPKDVAKKTRQFRQRKKKK